MAKQALFAGLVTDEFDRPVEVAFVGGEACYVINDQGFRRHISSEQVDRQVLGMLKAQVDGNEALLTEQTEKMIGQADLFSHAMILNQLKNMDKHFDALMETGIPEDARAYLGMLGFKVVINFHGEVVRFDQPSAPEEE